MNDREQFDLMVQDFARDVGKTFAQDEEGIWTIPAGGGVPVHVVYNEDMRQVITFVRLGEMMTGPFRAVWARGFLEANAFWGRSRGFTFALDHETGSLVVHDRRPFAYFMSSCHLAGYVNALTELVLETVRQLADLEDLCETAAEEDAGDAEKGV